MLVNIFSSNNTLPKYHTEGSVAFDISTNCDTKIVAQSMVYLPTGLIIEVPEGFGLFIFARSSLPKRGLMLANSVGIIDNDFHGKNDEIKLIVYNFTDKIVSVKNEERIAQGIFIPIEKAKWKPFVPNNNSRGGIGSTGN